MSPDPNLLCGCAEAARSVLISVHGTVLCYSALDGCLVHGAWLGGASTPGLHPVFIDASGLLALRIDGKAFVCSSLDHQVTEPVPQTDCLSGTCFEASPAAAGAFTLVAAERYLTAFPNGTVSRVEATASKWELFTSTEIR